MSASFFMRDFLHSEIAAIYGMANLPSDPDLAIHDHLPYSELQFFPKLAAFNISWHERPRRRITSYAPPRGVLTKPGCSNHQGDHSEWYKGFPEPAAVPAQSPDHRSIFAL